MKRRYFLLAIMALCLLLAACNHEHAWEAASCVSAQICPECGETEGEPLGHQWLEASCVGAKVCERCLQTMGSPLGHDWLDATCTEKKTCQRCAATEGNALGHDWQAATCTEAEICAVCGQMQGTPLGHSVNEWTVVTEATCTQEGLEEGECSVCKAVCQQAIPMIDHNPGEWEVTVEPTEDSKGVKSVCCTDCGKELEKEEFELSAEELERLYKSKCKSISYDNLSRKPGQYEGEYVKFSGKVVQVCYEATSFLYYSSYRVATSGSYNNVVYILVDNYGSDERILEDDWITFYGKFDGLYTYETVMGSTLTIPKIMVEYIE